uniref:Uncharacterized protein n=1 Tax=Oryza nivara TaxID=4536 RepID=A0A0E0IWF6_ORYNI
MFPCLNPLAAAAVSVIRSPELLTPTADWMAQATCSWRAPACCAISTQCEANSSVADTMAAAILEVWISELVVAAVTAATAAATRATDTMAYEENRRKNKGWRELLIDYMLQMAGNNGRSDHRVFRYSMGSNGVCGGGIAAAAASSSSISMPKVSAISLGFQALSMAILATRRLEGGRHTQSTRRGVWSRHAEEGRKNKGDTRLTGYEKAPSLLFGSKGRVLPIEPHKITLCQVLRMLTNDNDCHQAIAVREPEHELSYLPAVKSTPTSMKCPRMVAFLKSISPSPPRLAQDVPQHLWSLTGFGAGLGEEGVLALRGRPRRRRRTTAGATGMGQGGGRILKMEEGLGGGSRRRRGSRACATDKRSRGRRRWEGRRPEATKL